jgi:HSP20 family protein
MYERIPAGSVFLASQASKVYEAGWTPRVDIYSGADAWLVKCELAGIRTEDITVSLEGEGITIRGVRRDHISAEGWNQYSMEIPYSRFERAVALPGIGKPAAIVLDYREGMLLIRVRNGENSP